ncbi:hypothetical protein F503_08536 [Ophiostoma piceae UAMH 11346]|uniref:Secreted protein n=1 Tax=Ophiostoma piceae (strain UAMH 11346) TaxID=1262450 RepID=S3C9A5_OPHP1|nr:hypothetical protein F503_08536 [Ophiostoma piceae UAMH 11346]
MTLLLAISELVFAFILCTAVSISARDEVTSCSPLVACAQPRRIANANTAGGARYSTVADDERVSRVRKTTAPAVSQPTLEINGSDVDILSSYICSVAESVIRPSERPTVIDRAHQWPATNGVTRRTTFSSMDVIGRSVVHEKYTLARSQGRRDQVNPASAERER